jgi:predicted unusual protein kinase regulating ubiquinone biosynthesis (AarF/ABC1/UbiB family)
MYRARRRRITRFFLRMMISLIWWEVVLPRVGLGGLARVTRPERLRRAAAAFRALAVRMGGVLIKVGQFLSARLDVLPAQITRELAGLQDEVGAEHFSDIRGVIEAEFGVPLERKFTEFSPVPMASASIGQVHYARLCDTSPEGEPCPRVVVKVQRPRIQEIVEADLAAIRSVGGWASRFAVVRKRANVPALIEEFSRTLREETDYVHEGRNAERFAAAFAGKPEVLVPSVVWTHTTRRVLTLQDVGAIKITDYPAIQAAGISRSAVATRLLDTYLKQVFEDGFFHADPHPGNLFVLPSPSGGRWRLVFVDFGMTGTLAPDTFSALRDLLVSVGTRDAARLVEAFRKLGFLLPGADLALIEKASRAVFDRIWGKTTREMLAMGEEEMREMARQFGDLLYEMPFQIPEDLILLGRCVSILAGIATGLDPDFRVWDGLAPYARRLVEKETGGGLKLVLAEAGRILRSLVGLPQRVEGAARRLEEGRVEVHSPEIRQQTVRLETAVRKLGGAVVFSAVLLAGTALYLTGHGTEALAAAALDVLLGGWLAFGRGRQ